MMSNKKEYQIKISIIAPEHWPDFKALSDFVSKQALLSLLFLQTALRGFSLPIS